MKTSIISEEMERSGAESRKKFEIPMSDDPPAVDSLATTSLEATVA